VFASEQIRREVVALQKAGKPVVVSMGDLAASGGYWISMNADRIYADASTISGSIGIFGMIPTIPRALDKIGVHTDGVGTTAFAGAFDISRTLDPAVGQVIQSVIDKGYRDFIGKVADARDQPVDAIDQIARGRVWSGAQAKERGLVDELGNLQSAISDVATRAELGEGEYAVTYVEKTGTPFEQWFGGFASSRLGALWLRDSEFARGLMAQALPHAQADLKLLEGAIAPTAGVPVKALAYCFCALD
jgi:protease-4